VGRDEHDDDGATITQVDSGVMCEPTPVKTRELEQHSADHHSGQKLTDCNKCGKGFTSKDHLINHMESCVNTSIEDISVNFPARIPETPTSTAHEYTLHKNNQTQRLVTNAAGSPMSIFYNDMRTCQC
jgi:hypothetical protein